MTIETDKLVTVKNFANMKGVSTTAVYAWVSQGKEKSVKIDGMTFIVLSNDDYLTIKNK